MKSLSGRPKETLMPIWPIQVRVTVNYCVHVLAVNVGGLPITIFIHSFCMLLLSIFVREDDWAEQKLLEEKGRREVYDFGQTLSLERVILTSIWSSFLVVLIGRVVWQLAHGNGDLF
jgi:hypothetical protein